MIRALRFFVTVFMLLASSLPVWAGQSAALERGTAITDPLALRELDRGRFGLGRMLYPRRATLAPLANAELFGLPPMRPVRQAIDGEFDRYVERHKADLPKETIGVGEGFDFQLFDRAQLDSADTRFVLAGIVNRMDRAYVDEASRGEIRLIYPLTRTKPPRADDKGNLPPPAVTLDLLPKGKG